METRTKKPRADRFERDRRLSQVREWIGQCLRSEEIIKRGMAAWRQGERQMYKYLAKAYRQMAAAAAPERTRQWAEADECYRWMIREGLARIDTTVTRHTVTEQPDKDGKLVRKVTVTRRQLSPAAAMKSILSARLRMDKICGLEKVKPPTGPVGLDVNYGFWRPRTPVDPVDPNDPAGPDGPVFVKPAEARAQGVSRDKMPAGWISADPADHPDPYADAEPAGAPPAPVPGGPGPGFAADPDPPPAGFKPVKRPPPCGSGRVEPDTLPR